MPCQPVGTLPSPRKREKGRQPGEKRPQRVRGLSAAEKGGLGGPPRTPGRPAGGNEKTLTNVDSGSVATPACGRVEVEATGIRILRQGCARRLSDCAPGQAQGLLGLRQAFVRNFCPCRWRNHLVADRWHVFLPRGIPVQAEPQAPGTWHGLMSCFSIMQLGAAIARPIPRGRAPVGSSDGLRSRFRRGTYLYKRESR